MALYINGQEDQDKRMATLLQTATQLQQLKQQKEIAQQENDYRMKNMAQELQKNQAESQLGYAKLGLRPINPDLSTSPGGNLPSKMVSGAYGQSYVPDKNLSSGNYLITGYDQAGAPIFSKAPGKVANANAMSNQIQASIPSDLPQLGVDATPQDKKSFLTKLQPQDRANVLGMVEGRLDPTKSTSFRGKDRERLIGMAQMYDPSFDMSNFPARVSLTKSMSSGALSKAKISANTLIGHLDSLSQSFKELGNTDNQLVNSVVNTAKETFGKGNITKVQTDLNAVSDELANVFKQTGSTDITIKSWRDRFHENMSPEQYKSFINEGITLLKSRMEAISGQYQQVFGKPLDVGKILNPKSLDILSKLETSHANNPNIDPSLAAELKKRGL